MDKIRLAPNEMSEFADSTIFNMLKVNLTEGDVTETIKLRDAIFSGKIKQMKD